MLQDVWAVCAMHHQACLYLSKVSVNEDYLNQIWSEKCTRTKLGEKSKYVFLMQIVKSLRFHSLCQLVDYESYSPRKYLF